VALVTGTVSAPSRFARMRARGFDVRVVMLAATVIVMVPIQSSAREMRVAARHHLPRHRPGRPAAGQPPRLHIPATDDFSDASAGGRELAIATPPSIGDHPRTAIDYQLAPRGPVGSVGLLRPSDTRVAPGAGLRRGYPEVTAGAKLSYPF
jgi:hypothetical protein